MASNQAGDDVSGIRSERVERPFVEVAEYNVGRTPARANARYWNQTGAVAPWVTISDMPTYGVVESTKESVSAEAFAHVFGGYAMPAGTLIMSFKLTIGRVATLGIPAVHNEAIISIFPKPGIDQRYLGYYLSQVDLHAASGPPDHGQHP
jgi:type I restriction enzyme S subunit